MPVYIYVPFGRIIRIDWKFMIVKTQPFFYIVRLKKI